MLDLPETTRNKRGAWGGGVERAGVQLLGIWVWGLGFRV